MSKKKSLEEIEAILKAARGWGCAGVEIDGIKYALPPKEETKPAPSAVPELKADELIKPLSVFDEMTDEEQLFWATPHFDEIQEQKRLHQEAITNGVDRNG